MLQELELIKESLGLRSSANSGVNVHDSPRGQTPHESVDRQPDQLVSNDILLLITTHK